MPNHITNILTAPAEVLTALRGKELVDFNVIVPQPPELYVDDALSHAEGMAQLICGKIPLQPKESRNMADITDSLRLSSVLLDIQSGGVTEWEPRVFDSFVAMLRSYRACGAFNWYDWDLANWGTKWNAYDIEQRGETCIKFETAWSAPRPVLAALASRFPKAEIIHEWADEDIGSNLGRKTYFGPVVIDHDIEDPVDFALTITGNDREYYRKSPTSGLWESFDPEEDELANTERSSAEGV